MWITFSFTVQFYIRKCLEFYPPALANAFLTGLKYSFPAAHTLSDYILRIRYSTWKWIPHDKASRRFLTAILNAVESVLVFCFFLIRHHALPPCHGKRSVCASLRFQKGTAMLNLRIIECHLPPLYGHFPCCCRICTAAQVLGQTTVSFFELAYGKFTCLMFHGSQIP